MNRFTFIEWLDIMKSPMVIDHELTESGVNKQLPNRTSMIVFFRKRGVLLAVKINKNKFGSLN